MILFMSCLMLQVKIVTVFGKRQVVNGRRPKIWGFRILMINILFFYLGAYYMSEFYLSQFIELYTYDLCTFYLHEYKLKNIKEIFQNIPLAFTSCYQGGGLSLWIFPFIDTDWIITQRVFLFMPGRLPGFRSFLCSQDPSLLRLQPDIHTPFQYKPF